jgi:3-dehydrosphinganine reductase
VQFKDKIVLITGGSSGIGLATAQALAEAGAQVALAARSPARLQEALACLPPHPSRPHFTVSADVSDPQQAAELVEKTLHTAGRVDILINSAGVVQPGYVDKLPLEDYRTMMDVNYFGTVYVTKALLPSLLAQRSGWIVNVGSFVSRVSVFGYSAYAPSKFAVRGFSDALRMELKPHGIGVSIVYPPDTNTPQLAYENRYKPAELKLLLPELGVIQPEQAARAVLRGLQREKYEIIPDLGSKFLIYLDGLAGGWRYSVLDLLLARARRRINSKER